MKPDKRKAILEKLGILFRNYDAGNAADLPVSNEMLEKWRRAADTAVHYNGWFTPGNVRRAVSGWGEALRPEKIDKWMQRYDADKFRDEEGEKKVGVVMAGNIPLVGLHDLLSILITGHRAMVKLSSGDKKLMQLTIDSLMAIEPGLADRIHVVDQLRSFDAVIATGSNNTARYFEAYFGKYPNIIRKNRGSVAIISGDEEKEELEKIREDIFSYFGLGCRNVSKLFVPGGYDVDRFFRAMYPSSPVLDNHKYANNYTYNRTVYLMSKDEFYDNGFLILKKSEGISSPVSVLYYEEYRDEEDLAQKLKIQQDQIQCVVSGKNREGLNFGEAQRPDLWDYADNVDTVDFLLRLK